MCKAIALHASLENALNIVTIVMILSGNGLLKFTSRTKRKALYTKLVFLEATSLKIFNDTLIVLISTS